MIDKKTNRQTASQPNRRTDRQSRRREERRRKKGKELRSTPSCYGISNRTFGVKHNMENANSRYDIMKRQYPEIHIRIQDASMTLGILI